MILKKNLFLLNKVLMSNIRLHYMTLKRINVRSEWTSHFLSTAVIIYIYKYSVQYSV